MRPVPVVLRLLAFSLHSYLRILAAGYYRQTCQSPLFEYPIDRFSERRDLERAGIRNAELTDWQIGGRDCDVLRSLRRCVFGYVGFDDRIFGTECVSCCVLSQIVRNRCRLKDFSIRFGAVPHSFRTSSFLSSSWQIVRGDVLEIVSETSVFKVED